MGARLSRIAGSAAISSSSSAGQTTCMCGMPRIRATSSSAWWVGPLPSERKPGTAPTSVTGRLAMPTSVRMNSKARITRKVARACATGVRPRSARPAAAPIIVCSQMPTSMKRAPRTGGRLRIAARFSAVITTTSGRASASACSAAS